jgi:hypothetical protein
MNTMQIEKINLCIADDAGLKGKPFNYSLPHCVTAVCASVSDYIDKIKSLLTPHTHLVDCRTYYSESGKDLIIANNDGWSSPEPYSFDAMENVVGLTNQDYIEKAENLKLLVGKDYIKTLCILSDDTRVPDEGCKGRFNHLAEELKKHQYLRYTVDGTVGKAVHIIMIYNISLDSCVRIAKHHQYNSFIFVRNEEEGIKASLFVANAKGLVYHEAEMEKGILDLKLIPIDIISKHIEEIGKIVEERCQNPLYRGRFNQRLLESVSDKLTPRGKRVRRAELWGSHYKLLLF